MQSATKACPGPCSRALKRALSRLFGVQRANVFYFVNLVPDIIVGRHGGKSLGTENLILFRPVSVPRNSALALSLEVMDVPRFLLEHRKKAKFILVAGVPENRAVW